MRLRVEALERRELLSATYGASGPIGPQSGVEEPAGSVAFTASESAATIENTVANSAPGTTFFFNSGTYTDLSITPLTGDTFIGAAGTVLTSATQAEAFMSSNPNVTIDNIAITGYLPPWPFSTITANETTGWTIENVDVSGSSGEGVMLFDGGKLLNSDIYDNAVLGVKVNGLAGYPGTPEYLTTQGAPVLIENDIISGNNPNDVGNTEDEAGGIKVWSANNVTITDCTISNNVGHGVWFDTCFGGDVVENSLAQNNTMFGIYNEISNGTVIADNDLTGNGLSQSGQNWPQGGGIAVETSASVTVSGNVLSGDGNGILTLSDVRTDDNLNWQMVGVVVEDNSVSMSQGRDGSLWSSTAGGTSANVAWIGNTYTVTGSAGFVWNNWQESQITQADWEADGNDDSPPTITVTASGSTANYTAGASAVSVDSAITISSSETDLSGATLTISAGTLQPGDTLSFTSPVGSGISGSYAAGVLTLSGNATPAQYQTALQSVTFSSTSNSTAARDISIVALDNNLHAITASETVNVDAPVTITAAYVSGSAWTTPNFLNTTERFDTYLVNKGLGDPTIPTVGYALQTGANQLTPLPWANVNTISVTFSGAVSHIGLGSLKLVGGTGTGSVAAPSVTGFTSDGSNTYSWTLSGSLGNNKYVFAIATTGSSFGTPGSTQVTGANGAGISGTFATSQAFPSGNGLAGSTFDFFFDVLPGDGNQATTSTSSSDTALAKSVNNQHETSATYNPYVDYNGAGIDSAADIAFDGSHNNVHNSTLTPPTAPSDSQGVETTGFTALALGVQETGNSSAGSSSTATVSNVGSSAPAPSTTSTGTPSTTASGSGGTRSTTGNRDHGHSGVAASERFAAADEALSDLDLADLWA